MQEIKTKTGETLKSLSEGFTAYGGSVGLIQEGGFLIDFGPNVSLKPKAVATLEDVEMELECLEWFFDYGDME